MYNKQIRRSTLPSDAWVEVCEIPGTEDTGTCTCYLVMISIICIVYIFLCGDWTYLHALQEPLEYFCLNAQVNIGYE